MEVLTFVLLYLIKVSLAANVCPTMACSTSLADGVCMELDGTNGADATFSFKPCGGHEFCDYKNVQTFNVFQRKDTGYTIPSTVRKKAFCVDRSVNRQNLLSGAGCHHDFECRSGRCDMRCRGQYNDETCLSDEDCEHGYYCYTNATSSQTCQKELAVNQTCTEGTDICAQGYFCADVNSTGSKCVELFSQPDGASSTQSVVCSGGFLTGGNVCYSIKAAADTAGTANLTSPYSCTISSGDYCNAFDGSDTLVTGTIPCLCSWTTSTTLGYCAWKGGENDYSEYFAAVKEAIMNSKDCHYYTFKWILEYNLLSTDFFSSTFPFTDGFGEWYACITEPSKLNTVLRKLRHLLGYPGSESSVYTQCLNSHTLDVFNPQHWCPNSDRCLSHSLLTISVLLGGILSLMF